MNETMEKAESAVDSGAKKLIAEASITSGLVIRYITWAGRIDYLYGFEIKNSAIVESSRFDSSSSVILENQLIDVMSAIGLQLPADGHFAPFERGYWGEQT